MKRALPDMFAILALLLLPLAFFLPQTLGGKTLIPAENLYQYEPFATDAAQVGAPTPHNHLLSDLVLQNFQWKAFAKSQLAQGEVPLWNPHQFSGIPFLAAGQHSALYPLSAIYYVLELPVAYGWYTVINLWLAGVFMMAFVRALGVGRGAGVLAGVVYQLNGFVLASVVFQMMIGGFVWLPLLLWMCERVLNGQKTLASVAIGAGAVGMNILAGHAEITLYTLLIAGYYSAFRLVWMGWRERAWGALLGKAIWLLIMVGVGVALGAVQAIPLFEFAQTNWRAERSDLATVLSYAHPPRDLLQFVLPNFYGNPSHHRIFDVFSGQWVALSTPQTHTEWGIKNYVEGALYVGIMPLLLSAYALWTGWRIRHQHATHPPYCLLFAVLGVLAVLFMFGSPLYALLYSLPAFNQLNSPFRWVYALTVCVAVLSAFGMQALAQQPARKWGIAFSTAGGILIVGLGLSRVGYGALEPTLTRVFEGLTNATNAFPDVQLFYSYQVVNALVLAAILAIGGGLWWWAGRTHARPRTAHIWQVAMIALVSADLMVASWGFNPASDPALLAHTPASVAWLQERATEGERFRVITLDDPAQRPIMNANSLWRYGIDDVRGYDSIIPKPYVDYMRATAPQVQLDFNRIAPLYTAYPDSVPYDYQETLDSPRFALLNVRYLISHRSTIITHESVTAVYQDESVTIWEYAPTFPRAFTLPIDSITWDTASAWTQEGTQAARDAFTPVAIVADSGREKYLTLTLANESWLVISENMASGWRAFISPRNTTSPDEIALEMADINEILQGVRLPAGDWQVRLVYSPPTFQIGLFGSISGAAIILLLLGMWLWQTSVGTNHDGSSTTARVARNSIAPIILNLFNRGIDFAFLLVMLRLLTPDDVGTYYYLVVIFVWFDIFTNFGLDLFFIREVSREKDRAGHYFYNVSLLRIVLAFLGVPLLWGYLAIRQSTVTPPLTDAALLTVALLYVGLFPASLSKGMSSLFYAFEQAEKPATIATITTINKVIFGVVVLVLGWGIVGLAIVSIFNNLLTFGVLMASGRKLIGRIARWSPDWVLLRQMISGSWALLLNHFLATIFFQSDVVLLEGMKGAVTVAQYSVAYRWILAINIIPSFFTQALLPVMARQAQENRDTLRRTYTFGIKLMLALSLPTAIVFTFLAEPLTYLMGGEQYLPDGAIAIQLMIWSIPLGWMNSLTQYALVALDLQKRITGAFALAVTFNIVTNVLFIPAFSYQAAALTTIASELVLFIPFALLMQKGLGGRIAWHQLLWRPSLASGAMAFTAWALGSFNLLLALAVASAVYLVVLVALRPLDNEETALFARMLPQKVRRLVRLA